MKQKTEKNASQRKRFSKAWMETTMLGQHGTIFRDQPERFTTLFTHKAHNSYILKQGQQHSLSATKFSIDWNPADTTLPFHAPF